MNLLGFVVKENLRALTFWRAVCSELLATALLVFIGCGSVIIGNTATAAPMTSADIVRISLAFGFASNILIKTFGPVSGCHVNPAVTLAFAAIGKVSLARALIYTVAQLAGAAIGAGLLYGLVPHSMQGNLGSTTLRSEVSPAQGFGIEAVLTFVLVLAVSACLDEKRIDHCKMRITNPLTIGFTVSALNLVGIPFTGCSMNPARSFGPALVTSTWTSNHWIYWIGPLVGASCAAMLYHILISLHHLHLFKTAEVEGQFNKQSSPTTSSKNNQAGGRSIKLRPPSIDSTISTDSVVSVSSQVPPVEVPMESYNALGLQYV